MEIERKFMLSNDSWRKEVEYRKRITQWYISTDPERTVRVRNEDFDYVLCIKGKTEGASRIEVEAPLRPRDAEQLLLLRAPNTVAVTKSRYIINRDGVTWEIDEFLGENTGLIVAEVELSREDQSIHLPSWIGEEVTHDFRYSNSALSQHPFRNW